MSNLAPKPPLLGLPANMTLVDIMKKNGITPKTEPKTEAQILSVRAKVALSAQQIRNTTNIPNPRDDSIKLNADTEVDNSFAVLPIDNIQFYEHNPRKASNEAFAELKESIRINGIQSTLSVTKRPNTNYYIPFSGGNTRLLAIKELYEETKDPKFENIRVTIKAWRGEVSVMLAHIAENTQRGDMTFWDKANSILDVKKFFEEEQGREFSYRELEEKLMSAGIKTDLKAISVYVYASSYLYPIGTHLTGLAVSTIQPKVNAFIRLAKLYGIDEDEYNSEIFNPVILSTSEYLSETNTKFSVEKLLHDIGVVSENGK